MKRSLVIAVLIVAIGSFFGWQEARRLQTLRLEQQQLVAAAQRLGLSTDLHKEFSEASRTARPERSKSGGAAEARAFAAALIAFFRDMDADEDQYPGPEMQERALAVLDGLLAIDQAQLTILIDEVRRTPELDDDSRRGLLSFAINLLASDDPQAALGLFAEYVDLLDSEGRDDGDLRSALARWAERDPLAALDWIRDNADRFPNIIDDATEYAVVTGAARQDPHRAFQLLEMLEVRQPHWAAGAIVRTARSPAECTPMLKALREHLRTVEDPNDRRLLLSSISSLAGVLATDSFDTSMTWLKENELSREEAAAFADELPIRDIIDDTGRWIDWMADKLPAAKLLPKVETAVERWTNRDYAAAGEWLEESPAGPVRDTAVRTYAETIAPHQAGTAATWALTLPDGPARTELLDSIQQHWTHQDPAAAARFAEAHGLGDSSLPNNP